jgi:hypothetical protein
VHLSQYFRGTLPFGLLDKAGMVMGAKEGAGIRWGRSIRALAARAGPIVIGSFTKMELYTYPLFEQSIPAKSVVLGTAASAWLKSSNHGGCQPRQRVPVLNRKDLRAFLWHLSC